MPLSLVSLGSNLGDRARLLDDALARLERHPNVEVTKQSRYYETLPVGGPMAQPAFLNAAAILHTSLSPQSLLSLLQRVEAELGRQRIEHWGPRTIDLDLLLYEKLTLNEPTLIIPHPRMTWRRFVLEPAAEIAPKMVHPGTGWTVAQLLNNLDQTPWYVAIAGPIGVGKSTLASRISEKSGARLLAEQFDSARLQAFYHDPPSHAWQIELEFLEQRARQLGIDQAEWTRRDRPTISDFWFEQSRAFASIWLSAEQMSAYMALWQELQPLVVRPRLTVLLNAPMTALLARIRTREGKGEELLSIEQLQQIERALENQVAATQGPVLRLNALDQETACIELLAAVEAMR
jgi:2-amino-4-hydroxy-6-hydroxymethyldihydropteridine diphosphokinase